MPIMLEYHKKRANVWIVQPYEDTHASSSSLSLQYKQVAGVLNPH